MTMVTSARKSTVARLAAASAATLFPAPNPHNATSWEAAIHRRVCVTHHLRLKGAPVTTGTPAPTQTTAKRDLARARPSSAVPASNAKKAHVYLRQIGQS